MERGNLLLGPKSNARYHVSLAEMALKGLLSVSNARRFYGIEPYRTEKIAENVFGVVQGTDERSQNSFL